MNSKNYSHWIQSTLIHLALLGLGCVFYFLPRALETSEIHLENIDHGSVKKLLPNDHSSSESKSSKAEVSSVPTSSSSTNDAQISTAIMQAYLQEVANRIHKLKRYPKDAQMKEQEGVVEVLLEVAPDGTIVSSAIEKASSYESLNQAALIAIQKLGSLPPLPLSAEGKALERPIKLHIPIQFQLL